MKINILNSFVKSLNKFSMHESWWYKTYSFFRWDLWAFLSNIWKFRKELWEHRWWDYHFSLQILYRSIYIMEKGMHGGLEVRESRDKKIQKMQRLLKLLDNKINDRYIDIAEGELGYELIYNKIEFKEIGETGEADQKLYELVNTDTDEETKLNRTIYDKSKEIEENEWIEIWEILKGQSSTDFSNQLMDIIQEKEVEDSGVKKDWNDIFDGTGLRGWWD